jgi:hypothetical protein
MALLQESTHNARDRRVWRAEGRTWTLRGEHRRIVRNRTVKSFECFWFSLESIEIIRPRRETRADGSTTATVLLAANTVRFNEYGNHGNK